LQQRETDGPEKGLQGVVTGSPERVNHPRLARARAGVAWSEEDAIREGERGVALDLVSEDARNSPTSGTSSGGSYILVGEPQKALDQLAPLLTIPYDLSPGWLKIDPNFDPLRKNPRFQKLVAGGK
jgi:hypothetical protein